MKAVGRHFERVGAAWTREPVDSARCIMLFAPHDQPVLSDVIVHRSDNPRLAFAQHYWKLPPVVRPFTFRAVEIGAGCNVHTTAALGGEGFGYEWDGRRWLPFPHVGLVKIGQDVVIGAHTCIDRGALGDTIIGDGARIDNLVHIAHNVNVGAHAVIVAHALICGSVTIGERAWIGGGAIIKEGVTIGAGAIIGLGAVVTKDVPPGETWIGMPAGRMGS